MTDIAGGARGDWEAVKAYMGEARPYELGAHLCYWLRRSPRRLLHALSYYKFAARMIGPGRRVLEVGCGEGLGTWLLARECGSALGVDLDQEAVAVALRNWPPERSAGLGFRAIALEALDESGFAAAVCLDVIEHIERERAGAFLLALARRLTSEGVAVIGTPSLASDRYASPASRAGHVNLYDHDRLRAELGAVFRHVFLFGANDEVVHTGFPAMCHYILALAAGPRDAAGTRC